MRTSIFCVVFLLIVITPCIADDPNNPVTINYNSYEARIRELEDKIIELENRIAELESKRPALPARGPGPTSSTNNDPNKDSLRIERSTKAVKESQDLLELYEEQLKKLPTCYHLPLPDVNELEKLPHYYYQYAYYYLILMPHHRYRFMYLDNELHMSLDDELNWVIDNIELLDCIEKECRVIQNYAQRNRDLKIDRKDISKRLIELRSEWVGFGKVKDALYNSMPKGYRFMRSRCYQSISKRSVRNID